MASISVRLQGSVHRVTVKPPKLNDQGGVDSQDIEVVLHIPIDGNEGVRIKLPDLSRLQNGKTTNIILEETAPELSLGKSAKGSMEVKV